MRANKLKWFTRNCAPLFDTKPFQSDRLPFYSLIISLASAGANRNVKNEIVIRSLARRKIACYKLCIEKKTTTTKHNTKRIDVILSIFLQPTESWCRHAVYGNCELCVLLLLEKIIRAHMRWTRCCASIVWFKSRVSLRFDCATNKRNKHLCHSEKCMCNCLWSCSCRVRALWTLTAEHVCAHRWRFKSHK